MVDDDGARGARPRPWQYASSRPIAGRLASLSASWLMRDETDSVASGSTAMSMRKLTKASPVEKRNCSSMAPSPLFISFWYRNTAGSMPRASSRACFHFDAVGGDHKVGHRVGPADGT